MMVLRGHTGITGPNIISSAISAVHATRRFEAKLR
jgi:hypothetical protein